MVSGKHKSRTYRRVQRVTPGNKVNIQYKKRKPKIGTCPVTGEKLKGVLRERPRKMQNVAKTKKRPSRPYGGVLSSKAMRQTIKAKVRSE